MGWMFSCTLGNDGDLPYGGGAHIPEGYQVAKFAQLNGKWFCMLPINISTELIRKRFQAELIGTKAGGAR